MKKKICVIGSGPAGIYVAKRIIKATKNWQVDIFEKSAFFYGLIRKGMSPDLPEKENIIQGLKKTLLNKRVNIIPGMELGSDFKISEISKKYPVTVIAIGGDERKNKKITGCISGKDWAAAICGYGPLKDKSLLIPKWKKKRINIAILGHGNTAIDILRNIIYNEKLNFTKAQKSLNDANVRKILLLGKNPENITFGARNIREIGKICTNKSIKISTNIKKDEIIKLINNRAIKIMVNYIKDCDYKKNISDVLKNNYNEIYFNFNSNLKNIKKIKDKFKIEQNNYSFFVDHVISSIGYLRKKIPTIKKDEIGEYKLKESKYKNVYLAGWSQTNGKGGISTILNNSNLISSMILKDIIKTNL